VMLVGAFAGISFLTGLTIIGSQVADEVRGRVNAFVQTIVRLTLLGSLAVVPVIVGLVATRPVQVFGFAFTLDGTRVVMFAGGLLAAAIGSLAYRQMDDRRTAPMLPDLLAGMRRGEPRAGSGVLVTVEGSDPAETADQAGRLVTALRAAGHAVVELGGDERGRVDAAALSGPRARALAAAAVLADQVERVARPALAAGQLVVADRFLTGPLAALGGDALGGAALGTADRERLVEWASGRLRPDVSVLLDRAPAGPRPASGLAGEEHVLVQRLLAHLAAAEPHRYVVVDAAGDAEAIAEKVWSGVEPALPPVATSGAEAPVSGGLP